MITPNFNFDGRCEEAMLLYKKAFDAEITCLLRYADANPLDNDIVPSDAGKSLIYHAEMRIKGQRVMMCDNMDVPFTKSLSLSLVVTMETKEEVLRAYNVLSDGATILYPPHGTTYSSCETVLVDRFGFRWGIMTEQTER